MDRNAAAEIGSVEKLASILAKRTRILKDLVE
ncbi:Adenine-specific methyltransferase (plasmid) [Borrelia nietonii YOR]|nr:Adenine-specific methyltransferase [Borrelia nietonii YOR]